MPTPENGALFRINGQELTGRELERCLRIAGRWEAIQGAINQVVLNQAFDELKITVSPDEIDQFMDVYRARNGLLTAAATVQWLSACKLTDDDFVLLLQQELKLSKFKEFLAQGKIDQRFAYDKVNLERVELYRIIIDDESVARELMVQLKEGSHFFDMARTYSQDESTRRQCGYLGIVRRSELRPEIESLVFAGVEGQIVGPVKSAGAFHIYRVEKLYPARLDDATRELLKEQLFREWLRVSLETSAIESLNGDLAEA